MTEIDKDGVEVDETISLPASSLKLCRFSRWDNGKLVVSCDCWLVCKVSEAIAARGSDMIWSVKNCWATAVVAVISACCWTDFTNTCSADGVLVFEVSWRLCISCSVVIVCDGRLVRSGMSFGFWLREIWGTSFWTSFASKIFWLIAWLLFCKKKRKKMSIEKIYLQLQIRRNKIAIFIADKINKTIEIQGVAENTSQILNWHLHGAREHRQMVKVAPSTECFTMLIIPSTRCDKNNSHILNCHLYDVSELRQVVKVAPST